MPRPPRKAIRPHPAFMMRYALPILAWATLAVIVFATLSPLGERPRLPMAVDLERSGAFLLAGLLLALAYPRRIWWLLALLPLAIIGMEWLQTFRPDRHGRVEDALVKLAGAALGLTLGWLASRIRSGIRER